jgi:serine/threonine protein kinase
LHSGNIFSHDINYSVIGDLGLCQQVVNEKNNSNKIFGVIPYLAPEVLSKKPYTKKSDIYSFGMIMWEFTTGKKPFHDRPHNHLLILDILNGERPQVTEDTPEFYADLMKKCWDHNPENRPTAEEIYRCLHKYYYFNITEENKKIIESAENKRQKILASEKYLSDKRDYKHHPQSFYKSRLLNVLIQQAESLNFSSEQQDSNIHNLFLSQK